jgi:putative transposase
MKRSYSTDLTNAEWECIEPYVPAPSKRGRPRIYDTREILDAIFYLLRSGCPWRLLPRDFPPWCTVYHYFRRWSLDGTRERVNRTIRELLRARLGRNPQPSAAIVDSQSAKTSGVGREARGYDGGKKVRGRKRHLLVDTEGLVLKAKVHSAKVPDQDGIKLLLKGVGDRLGRLSHLRLAEVAPASRLRSLAPPLGGRKDLRLDLPQPSDEQGLREIVCHQRGIRLRSNDALDGKAASPCLGIFKQSLYALG